MQGQTHVQCQDRDGDGEVQHQVPRVGGWDLPVFGQPQGHLLHETAPFAGHEPEVRMVYDAPVPQSV